MMKSGMVALAALIAAAPLAASGTNRATPTNPFAADSAVLDLRGLDLTSVDGQQRLAIRMDQAADAVCGTGMSSIHLALGAQARECRQDVFADIKARIAAATAHADITRNRLALR